MAARASFFERFLVVFNYFMSAWTAVIVENSLACKRCFSVDMGKGSFHI